VTEGISHETQKIIQYMLEEEKHVQELLNMNDGLGWEEMNFKASLFYVCVIRKILFIQSFSLLLTEKKINIIRDKVDTILQHSG
jgi:hypothetical protein